ncbi:arginase family protein [Actinobacteria bacterium YIM 96077]|uniref:Arginase family protein n=1 Tax=Phytoactinopolyspora halophila TaxID=1981511 RepID=A0A329QIK9_9ACTN|nr:arginase family protein [Phytoactinopolyspora halophila]AYY14017.1 arginase family protein [Actinobacteria bacterium YIM 96077]RAW10268.1 arginase family protein [Phytoactinopolyspora halophila]
MARILVPYHLDEYLSGLDVPLDIDSTVVVDLPEGDTWQRMAFLYRRVADVVAADARDGGTPIVLSGDCTTSFGVMAALQREGVDPGIVWFDAHGDVQTLETSSSGYLGGMPLRMLVGYRPELMAEPLGLRAVPEERAVLVDARDLDPPEVEYLATAAIGRSGVYELSAQELPDGPLYLHVDLDVVDPSELPGQTIPVAGGPGLDATFAAINRVLETGRVAAVGLACTWNVNQGKEAAERVRPYLENALAAARNLR